MGYVFLFLIGFGMAVAGGVSVIGYMNFLPAGVSWLEYFIFIRSRPECYFLPIGLILMSIIIYRFPNNS
ncbi:hypothetical protein DX933_05980 [Ornithinibacillus gellani]|uniref:hypothetical protein n=1 Tax=Ornithinibacillus gellani TaxID=2293253 RepID=UPI000F473267|nr:hypothetical protein [Ornithinibacillus gellani]TQS75815.1 hypothetical protein DX933_05980 [Ornithinibacillus gellani]